MEKTNTNVANASEQALQQTVFTATSTHNAKIIVDTASKQIFIEYGNSKSDNLFGVTFSTQTRNSKTEFYIPVAKTNIENYVDKNGKPVLHFLFDFGEHTHAVYATLKPNANNKVRTVPKPNTHTVEYTPLFDFFKFLENTDSKQALKQITNNVEHLKTQIAELEQKQVILNAITASEQARKYFAQIACDSQKELEKERTAQFAELDKIKMLSKMLENLNYEQAATVLGVYSFEYYSVSLNNSDSGISFDYTEQARTPHKTNYADLADTIKKQAKSELDKMQQDFERLQDSTKNANCTPEPKSDSNASDSIKQAIKERTKTVC